MNWTEAQVKQVEQRIQARAPVTTHVAHQDERPRKGRVPASPPEREVLRTVLNVLERHPKVAWARRLNNGRLQGVRFGFVGCSDVIGQMRDGRFIAVETKRENGRGPTGAQGTFLALVQRNNGIAGVVRSVDELMELLKQEAA